MKSVEQLSSHRKHRNRCIIKRMREGEPLHSFDSWSSWFPPRPIVKKDPKAMLQLYRPSKNSNDGL